MSGIHIKAIKEHLGVDLIIDDAPNVILIDGDEVKIERARLVIEHLIRDRKVTVSKIVEYKKLYS